MKKVKLNKVADAILKVIICQLNLKCICITVYVSEICDLRIDFRFLKVLHTNIFVQ